ncbi:MAG: helix-turn-helix domain-containing protein [Minisyncoccia bacterium]
MAKIRSPEELKSTTGLITINEAASLLLMCVPKVYTKAMRGEIPSFKIGRSRRFKTADIENWIEQQRAA